MTSTNNHPSPASIARARRGRRAGSKVRYPRQNLSVEQLEVRQLMAADAARHEDLLATGLAAGTTYAFGVAAFNASGSRQSNQASATTRGISLPSSPSLTATGVSESQILLEWNGVANATGYRVFQWNPGSGKWTRIATFNANARLHFVESLPRDTSFTFKIAAFNKRGTAESVPVSAKTMLVLQSAPSLSATAISSSKVSLTWSSVANADGYVIEQYVEEFGSVGLRLIAKLGANATAYTVAGLARETAYKFSVTAFNRHSCLRSNAATATTLVPRPADPALSATAISSSSIRISWNDVAEEDGYRIMQGSGSAWSQIATLGRDATSFTVSNLPANAPFSFKIIAFNKGGHGESNVASAFTARRVPGTPSIAVSTVSSNSIDLGWSDVADEDGYRVLQRSGDAWSPIATLGRNVTTFTVAGLAPRTTYSLKVVAFNDAGDAESNVATPTTLRPPPGVPSLAVSAVTTGSIGLSWNDVTDEDGYRIMQRAGGTWLQVATLGSAATSYMVSNLTANTTYSFRVDAFNESGSVESNLASATTVRGAPGTPSIFVSPLTSDSIGLAWSDVADEDGYRILQRSGDTWSPIATMGRDATTFTVAGLTPRTTYSFKVVAFNDIGVAESIVATPTTLPPLPGISSPTAISLSASSIDLYWKDVAEEDGYRIMQMAGNTWSQVATLGRDATSFTVSNLTASTSYTFKLLAFNNAGSVESIALTATTQAPAGPAFSTPTFNPTFGWGLVDAAAAVGSVAHRDTAFPSVPNRGGRDWANDMINAPEVWAQGYTGRGVVVAVVDSGVDYSHPDLYANIWINQREIPATLRSSITDVDRDGMITFRDLNNVTNASFVIDVDHNNRIDADDLRSDRRWMDGRDDDGDGMADDLFGRDFVGNDNDPNDDIDLSLRPDGPNGQLRAGNPGHGTHVSGTIAAMNNGLGATGVAYDALVMPVRVMNARGYGSNDVIASGIRFAVDHGANVINLSLGGVASSEISSAVSYASSRSVAVVIAAGNAGAASPMAPADMASIRGGKIISVGAVDSTGSLASFSNRAGSSSAMRHIVAPGVSIYSTLPRAGIGRDFGNQNGFGSMSGTSMAAPHVAGVVALCRSTFTNSPTNWQRISWAKIAVGTARQPAASGSMAAVANGVAQAGIVSATTPGIRGTSLGLPTPQGGMSVNGQPAEAMRAFAMVTERADDRPAAFHPAGARTVRPDESTRGVVAAPQSALTASLPRLTVGGIRS